MNYPYKIVNFSGYCNTCKDEDTPETEMPCDECLSTPVREGTREPEKYVKRAQNDKH